MTIYISYFYQIRFFTPNMIPLSTCLSDPAWFHGGIKDKGVQFKDKRGVWNGLRAEPFVPGPTCSNECTGAEKCDTKDPNTCTFLHNYRLQLDLLDFADIVRRLERVGKAVQEHEGFSEESIPVLIVYEAPNNPCSERRVIQEWFKKNGYELKEWQKPKQ